MSVEMLIAGIILYFLFFILCYLSTGTDERNLKSFYSYPDEVQTLLKEDKNLKNGIPVKKSASIVFYSNVMVFFILFTINRLPIKAFNF